MLALTVANIPAAFLGSAQSQTADVLRRLHDRQLRLLYVSPEFVDGAIDGSAAAAELWRSLSQQVRLLAVDEAHCISAWGHDFRRSYKRLGELRGRLAADVPLLALTATATERVRADIRRSLRMRAERTVCTGFDRPNLEFVVRAKGASVWHDLSGVVVRGRAAEVAEVADGAAPAEGQLGSTIVYCLTRSMTENVAAVLQANGVECAGYHAGMGPAQRQAIHEQFVRDRLQVTWGKRVHLATRY